MVPPNFAPAPFGAWGSYAAAAQQASAGYGGLQQQQLMAFAQQMQQQAQQQAQQAAAGQGGDQSASTAQQQAQQQQQQMQLQAQQMMMAGYPAFLLGGQFGMVRACHPCSSCAFSSGLLLTGTELRHMPWTLATVTDLAVILAQHHAGAPSNFTSVHFISPYPP